jgi:hypothetical protein
MSIENKDDGKFKNGFIFDATKDDVEIYDSIDLKTISCTFHDDKMTCDFVNLKITNIPLTFDDFFTFCQSGKEVCYDKDGVQIELTTSLLKISKRGISRLNLQNTYGTLAFNSNPISVKMEINFERIINDDYFFTELIRSDDMQEQLLYTSLFYEICDPESSDKGPEIARRETVDQFLCKKSVETRLQFLSLVKQLVCWMNEIPKITHKLAVLSNGKTFNKNNQEINTYDIKDSQKLKEQEIILFGPWQKIVFFTRQLYDYRADFDVNNVEWTRIIDYLGQQRILLNDLDYGVVMRIEMYTNTYNALEGRIVDFEKYTLSELQTTAHNMRGGKSHNKSPMKKSSHTVYFVSIFLILFCLVYMIGPSLEALDD